MDNYIALSYWDLAAASILIFINAGLLAIVDADADGNWVAPRTPALFVPCCDFSLQRPARVQRIRGIPWCRNRHAEHAHHIVANEFVDDAAMRLDRAHRAAAKRAQELGDGLGVQVSRQCRKPADVGEQDGGMLAPPMLQRLDVRLSQ